MIIGLRVVVPLIVGRRHLGRSLARIAEVDGVRPFLDAKANAGLAALLVIDQDHSPELMRRR